MKRNSILALILFVVTLLVFIPTSPPAEAQVEQKVFLSDTVKNAEVLTSSWVTHKGDHLGIWISATQTNDSIRANLYYQQKFDSDTLPRVYLKGLIVQGKFYFQIDTYPGAAIRFISVGRDSNATAGTTNALKMTAAIRSK